MTKSPRNNFATRKTKPWTYSVKSCAFVVTIFSVLLGSFVAKVTRQERVVRKVLANGGIVSYDFEKVDILEKYVSSSSEIIFPDAGIFRPNSTNLNFVGNVVGVAISNEDDGNFDEIAKLRSLRKLIHSGTQSEDIPKIAKLRRLSQLILFNPEISESDFDRLKSALPNCDITWVGFGGPLDWEK